MVHLVTWIVGSILILLSGVHLYWMAGGKKGTIAVVPSKGRKPLFRPTMAATGAVALSLAAAGWFALALGGAAGRLPLSESFYSYGGWALSAIFLIRAVGDFRWVGFFKKHKGTVFAKWDSALYSPLCVFLGVCLVIMTLH
ncbi:DUF3995 domain-containing protein [Paenibacillus aurantiacus]|uniref:DUF3995 domain-containing protein n=1 Tax=Paenibacillus aurantiacus TaxID=1936118 RepID=A0ABV5KXP8_9BACL